jgi:hypothetical protein
VYFKLLFGSLEACIAAACSGFSFPFSTSRWMNRAEASSCCCCSAGWLYTNHIATADTKANNNMGATQFAAQGGLAATSSNTSPGEASTLNIRAHSDVGAAGVLSGAPASGELEPGSIGFMG